MGDLSFMDKEVAPLSETERCQQIYRECIASNCATARQAIGSLGRYTRLLVSRPAYGTRAEDELEQLDLMLSELHLAVKLARAAYAKLPVNQPLIAAE